MKAKLAALVLVFAAMPTLAKDHSAEFQTGKLVPWETTTYGENCNPGIVVAVHCSQKTTLCIQSSLVARHTS